MILQMVENDLNFFDTPNWGIILTALGVIIAVAGTVIALIYSKRKWIYIFVTDNVMLPDVADLIGEQSKNGTTENRNTKIFEIEVLISNLGNHCFRSEDFQSHIAIELYDKQGTFIDCQTFSNNRYSKAHFRIEKSIIKATKFDDFEKGNNILLKIKYAANQSCSGNIHAKIRGLKEINEKIEAVFHNNDDQYLRMKYKNDIIYGIVVFLFQLYLYYILFKISFDKTDNFMLEYIRTYSWAVLFRDETIYLLIYFLFALLISTKVMKFLHFFFYPFKWTIRDTHWVKINETKRT